jgi:hypothetical protein
VLSLIITTSLMRDMYIRPSLSYYSKNVSISVDDCPYAISTDYPKKYLLS